MKWLETNMSKLMSLFGAIVLCGAIGEQFGHPIIGAVSGIGLWLLMREVLDEDEYG